MEKVRVTTDRAGNVIIQSKDSPAYGYIRLEQRRPIKNEKGFTNMKKVTALVPGLIKDLKRKNWKKDQLLDGKIIFKEQLNPFDYKHPENDYKIAGKTGIVCRIYGEPIYRKAFYVTDPREEDSYITQEDGTILSHTNKDEIKEAYALIAQKTT